MQQVPKPQYALFLNMQQVTIQNNLEPVFPWSKTLSFNSK